MLVVKNKFGKNIIARIHTRGCIDLLALGRVKALHADLFFFLSPQHVHFLFRSDVEMSALKKNCSSLCVYVKVFFLVCVERVTRHSTNCQYFLHGWQGNVNSSLAMSMLAVRPHFF